MVGPDAPGVGAPYELCVLVALRNAIRRREVWVAGAGRWRDPEADLPTDSEVNREAHYAAIRAPLDPTAFIADLRSRMDSALAGLSAALAADTAGGVRIGTWAHVHLVRTSPTCKNASRGSLPSRRGGRRGWLDMRRSGSR